MIFPTVTGSNLLRQKVTLPDGLQGRLNLVFVAFQRRQQMEVDSWSPLADALERSTDGLFSYELPVIESRGAVSRLFINEGMRAGIPNARVRERTITLYLDKAVFRSALEMPDEDHVYILLVDRRGQVLFRARGPHTPEAEVALRGAPAGARPGICPACGRAERAPGRAAGPGAGVRPARGEPFTIAVGDEVLADLRRRIRATRWPDEAPGDAWAQGTDLAYLSEVLAYWAERFDWRAQERALNAFAPLPGRRRRRPHPLRARAGAARARYPADPDARLAQLLRRIPAARAAADRPAGPRHRRAGVRRRHPVAARLRVLRAAGPRRA